MMFDDIRLESGRNTTPSMRMFDHVNFWYNSLPDDLKPLCGEEAQGTFSTKLLFNLRVRQIKIWICLGALRSPGDSSSDIIRAVTSAAGNTIQELSSLNLMSDIYRKRHLCFEEFIISALVATFVALGPEPAADRQAARDNVRSALALVRSLHDNSHITGRLERMLRGLHDANVVFRGGGRGAGWKSVV